MRIRGIGVGTGLTSLNGLTGATQTFADTDDTNVTLAITSSGTVHTFALGWASTLAAARLNANVVQAITNDTNVTGSIATQTLTLGWTGTLAASRLTGTDIATVGTITTGTWTGTAIANAYIATALSGKTYSSASQAAFTLNPWGTNAGETGEIRFLELAATGTNYVGFKSPDALAGNTIYTLPIAFPASDLVLQSTSAGVLSWVAGGTGITTLNTLTAATQTFADTDDTNVTLTISSSVSTHTFALGWTGTLAASRLTGTDIATVGTITTGVWQGTAIRAASLHHSILLNQVYS